MIRTRRLAGLGRTAHPLRLAMAGTALAVCAGGASPAEAQIFWPGVGPYGGPAYQQREYRRPAPLPPGVIVELLVNDHRFRRVNRPQFAGHLYVVEGVDRTGAIVRAYVDPYDGRLIDLDLLRPAPRRGDGYARLPAEPERQGPGRLAPGRLAPEQLSPAPQRRQPEARPAPPARPEPRNAARPPAPAPSVVPPAVTPRPAPERPAAAPSGVDPAQTRLPTAPDRAPPLTRPPEPRPSEAPAPAAPPPQAAVPPLPSRPLAPAVPPVAAPGASPVAPALLDDASQRPNAAPTPDVPPAGLD